MWSLLLCIQRTRYNGNNYSSFLPVFYVYMQKKDQEKRTDYSKAKKHDYGKSMGKLTRSAEDGVGNFKFDIFLL